MATLKWCEERWRATHTAPCRLQCRCCGVRLRPSPSPRPPSDPPRGEEGGRRGGWSESTLTSQGVTADVGRNGYLRALHVLRTGWAAVASALLPLPSHLTAAGQGENVEKPKARQCAASLHPSYPLIYSGILPCFRAGRLWRFVRARRRARIRAGRVSRGSITASMYPRSAATYGFAKRF